MRSSPEIEGETKCIHLPEIGGTTIIIFTVTDLYEASEMQSGHQRKSFLTVLIACENIQKFSSIGGLVMGRHFSSVTCTNALSNTRD